MEKNLPEWLDKSYLAIVIQGGEEKKPKVTVDEFSAVIAVAAGNNYTSRIYRVKVKYTIEGSVKKSQTFIIKAPLVHFQTSTEMGIGQIFLREPQIYYDLLPKMKEKIHHEFGPITFYNPQQSRGVLVMQDMKETGYILCNKIEQLDYAHCELVFKMIAKFHATSVALYHEIPEQIETLGKEPIFNETSPFPHFFKPLLEPVTQVIVSELKKTGDSEPTIQFLLSKKDQLMTSLFALCKPRKDRLNVLNHGDLWTSNMLFKYDESGNVTDVKFIDFQATRYMTPAVDIQYFTWTSANEDVRENKLNELYDVYLQTLNETLEKLGCKERYTSEELWEDYKSAIDFSIAVTCQTLPMILAETEAAAAMESIDPKEFFTTGKIHPAFLKIYSGKHYVEKVPTIMKQIYKLSTKL